MTRFGKKFNWIATLVVVLTLAVPWAVFADDVIPDADGITPYTEIQNYSFGSVCAGAAYQYPLYLVIKRAGNYPSTNVYANGTTIAVTSAIQPGAGAGLATTVTEGQIALPSDWGDLQPGQTYTSDSAAATITLTPAGPAGPYSGTVRYSAAGTRSTSGTLTRTADIAVTWNIIDCTPVDKTAPVISYVLTPNSPDGSNGWYKSNVTLTWTVTENESPSSLVKTGCVDQNITADQQETTYSCSATSDGGSAGPVEVKIKRDATAPTISAALDKSPAVSGWFNLTTGAPTVSFTCGDAMSGVASCPAAYLFVEGANQSKSGTVTDNAGNTASAGVSDVNVDLTAPTITASLAPARPVSGWWNIASGAPTVSFTCSDATSGLAGACPASHTFGEGVDQSYSQAISDNAGNSASAGVSDVDVDLTAPTITAAATTGPNAAGWYNSDVTVSFTCNDALSGISAGTCPANQVLSSEGTAVSSTAQTVTDAAGNVSAPSNVVTVKIDKTAPGITWSSPEPADGGIYYFGFVPAEPTCTAVDALSGPNGCTVTGYGTTVGPHTMTATAYDVADNSSSDQRTYTVLAWTLNGFFQPVDMDKLNTVKGGSTVPLKFEVFAGSTELTDTSVVKSFVQTRVACDTAATMDEIEVTTTGGTSLRYDATGGQFIQNWQTPKLPGTCYRVTMTTDDGSSLVANFKLK